MLNQEERIIIIEATEDIQVQSVVVMTVLHSRKIFYFCPYCFRDNKFTTSESFSFTTCYSCLKTFKNF